MRLGDILYLVFLLAIGLGLTMWVFRKKRASKSKCEHCVRIKALEEDVQTLYGRIGVLLGDHHPGGMRAPANSDRFKDKIAEMGQKSDVKKHISDSLE